MNDTDISPRAQWAQRSIREKIYQELREIRARESSQDSQSFRAVGPLPLGSLFDATPLSPLRLPTDDNRPPPEEIVPPQAPPHDGTRDGNDAGFVDQRPGAEVPHWGEEHRICIIGAGVTGLYIAMILDSLQIPGLKYEILEASDRAGGRLFTHRFSDKPHDYYDIGAMRFPHIKIMDRTFKLFEDLKVPLIKYYLTSAQGALKCPTMYNDITVLAGDDPGPDPYRVSVRNGGSVPDDTVDNVDDLLNDAFGPFKAEMVENFEKGFKKLMQYDEYSTREFLKNPPAAELDTNTNSHPAKKLDFFTIQWLETNNTSSGLFDQAFSESVIDSFDFDNPEKGKIEEWSCIDGGSRLITEGMLEKVQQPVQFGKRVKKIAQLMSIDGSSLKEDGELVIEVAGESEPRKPYTTVFNTTSLACLQRVDLTELPLHPSQKDAIRSLHYDDSAKVAIKFAYPWWITKCGITKGGVASTDIPLRTCVYPSYNIDDPQTEPAVLLCSYTWAQDATRIGSLIDNRSSPLHEEELKDVMIHNLARLHRDNFNQARKSKGEPELTLAEVYAVINDAYLEHHAFSWSHDPYTSGAFALFGPGQFTNLYPYLSRPTAGSRFHFCGEASSAHHAWIVGSLDSAVASVHRFLRRFNLWWHILKLKKIWGKAPEVEDEKDGTLHLQVLLGMLPSDMMVQV